MASRRPVGDPHQHVRLELHGAELELLLRALNHLLDHYTPGLNQTMAYEDLLAITAKVLEANDRLYVPRRPDRAHRS